MKNFDAWNSRKKRVHGSEQPRRFFFRNREVWWCALGLNVGVETDGKSDLFVRPVLIVRRFNEEMFWGVPLTTKSKEGFFVFPVMHAAGQSFAILNQLRNISSKRLVSRIGVIPSEQFVEIRNKLISFLLPDTKPPHVSMWGS